MTRFWVFLLAVFLLSACSASGEEPLPPETEEGILIYASLNPISNMIQANVDHFNEDHEDVQIEIRDYSNEGGPERLLLELMAGRVPDIIDLHRHAVITHKYGMSWEAGYSGIDLDISLQNPKHDTDMTVEYWMPYRQLVQKGYLEDLWPYIESDPELGRDAVLEAPLKAAEVNGGLYMLFKEFSVSTMIGPESLVGDQFGWTLEELMEAFAAMPEDSSILRYDAVRDDVYSSLISPTLSRYVDWESGQCSFDSDEFRNLLGFLKCFPEESETALSPEEVQDEVVRRILNGRQLLAPVTIGWLEDIPFEDTYFGEPASYIGYPTADGSFGSSFLLHGNTLAMSSTCKDKEAAWDFMRKLIVRRYGWGSMERTRKYFSIRIPVNREDYEMGNRVDMAAEADVPPVAANYGKVKFVVEPPDQNDLQRFETLINSTTQIYWPDDKLSDIIWEAAGPYFAGDKTIDETIALIQNRTMLYINENR